MIGLISFQFRRVRQIGRLCLALASIGFVGSCGAPAQDRERAAITAASASLPLEASATLQELMQYEIDPAADSIWDSVGSSTTADGTLQKSPRTPEDWTNLRRSAVILLEATNLLVIPQRKVSVKGFPSDGPGVLSSLEIEKRLADDPGSFNALAQSLRQSARRVLAAIEAHDSTGLMREGAELDSACEACHVANWYPRQIVPPLPENPPQPL